jgi:hypothetical protein
MFQTSLRKWFTPILPYLAIGIGIFWFKNAWAALLGFHSAIILSLLLAKSQFPIKTLLKSSNIRWVLLSILLSGGGGIFLYLFWSFFGIASDLSTHIEALGLYPYTWLPFVAYFSLVNPFIEEYFWRGYLGSSTKKLYISDLVSAGFHGMILFGNVKMLSIIYSLTVLSWLAGSGARLRVKTMGCSPLCSGMWQPISRSL